MKESKCKYCENLYFPSNELNVLCDTCEEDGFINSKINPFGWRIAVHDAEGEELTYEFVESIGGLDCALSNIKSNIMEFYQND